MSFLTWIGNIHEYYRVPWENHWIFFPWHSWDLHIHDRLEIERRIVLNPIIHSTIGYSSLPANIPTWSTSILTISATACNQSIFSDLQYYILNLDEIGYDMFSILIVSRYFFVRDIGDSQNLHGKQTIHLSTAKRVCANRRSQLTLPFIRPFINFLCSSQFPFKPLRSCTDCPCFRANGSL